MGWIEDYYTNCVSDFISGDQKSIVKVEAWLKDNPCKIESINNMTKDIVEEYMCRIDYGDHQDKVREIIRQEVFDHIVRAYATGWRFRRVD